MIDAVSLFGVAWEAVEPAHVRALLNEREHEPLHWEAKGTALDRHEVRKQVCGFANSHDGGFLILGARWDNRSKSWLVDGMEFPDEPPLWVNNAIRGIVPRPTIDTHAWALEGTGEGRTLSVTRIEPVAIPPAIARGVVYERVSGATESVRDGQRLAALFQRGDLRRKTAEAEADHVAGWAMSELGTWFNSGSGVAVGSLAIARAGTAEDIAGRLFTPAFVAHLENAARRLPAEGPMPQRVDWSQHALVAPVASPGNLDRSGLVLATWHGVTAVAFLINGVTDADPRIFTDEHLRSAWQTAAALQDPLGGFGESFVTIYARADPLGAAAKVGISGNLEVRRTNLPADYDLDVQLASVGREIRRAAGGQVFEPETRP